jgi:hypothetical protein
MIAGLSKAVTLYLAQVLALTAIFLSLFAYLAPTLLLHDRVALLTVTPSTTLVQAGPPQGVDGPSVFLGALGTFFLHNYSLSWTNLCLLGSCSRHNNAGAINCTDASISPTYGT